MFCSKQTAEDVMACAARRLASFFNSGLQKEKFSSDHSHIKWYVLQQACCRVCDGMRSQTAGQILQLRAAHNLGKLNINRATNDTQCFGV
jgi:hypothetical protein